MARKPVYLAKECGQAWLPDGYSQIFRMYLFGPLGFLDYGSATLHCKICHLATLWTGFSDKETEGNFIDVNEGVYMEENFDPFPMPNSGRNGGRAQNCASAWRASPYESSWYDTECNRKNVASFCRIAKNPRLQMRGEG